MERENPLRHVHSYNTLVLGLADTLPPGPGTEFLKRLTIPVLKPHYNTGPHRMYNASVEEYFHTWLAENKISVRQFAKSEAYAQKFVNDVLNQPPNTKIGSYLKANWNGAKALKGAVILGAAFTIWGAYASAADGELIKAANDYKRAAAKGDSPALDLEAIAVAIAVQNMTGDYFTTMYVLDVLLQ